MQRAEPAGQPVRRERDGENSRTKNTGTWRTGRTSTASTYPTDAAVTVTSGAAPAGSGRRTDRSRSKRSRTTG
ncbi:hypothetical protein [Actinomadura rifamycini]|uniref:hypothetical protein n=1 Tax=Actinomadura rifamycini TaxID=31962 RepID=UPI00047E2C97|nr:hypothetical protein [Actinomadura rifamycini]